MPEIPHDEVVLAVPHLHLVSKKRLADIVRIGIEVGISHWGQVDELNPVPGHKIDFPYECVLHPDGKLAIAANETDEVWVLSHEDFKLAFQMMASTNPLIISSHHWENFIAGEETEETGDVFIQLALFGEIQFTPPN